MFHCPKADCDQILKKGDIFCSKCESLICRQCKSVAHSGACEKIIVYDGTFKTHKCPKCRAIIIKDGGCPHMRCSACSYEWCWICGFQDINGENAPREKFNPHDFLVIPCAIFQTMLQMKWYYGLPAGISLFALVPLVMFIAIIACLFKGLLDIGHKYRLDSYFTCKKNWWLLLIVPFWVCVTLIFMAISASIVLLGIIPFYILALFVFIRMLWWWKNK